MMVLQTGRESQCFGNARIPRSATGQGPLATARPLRRTRGAIGDRNRRSRVPGNSSAHRDIGLEPKFSNMTGPGAHRRCEGSPDTESVWHRARRRQGQTAARRPGRPTLPPSALGAIWILRSRNEESCSLPSRRAGELPQRKKESAALTNSPCEARAVRAPGYAGLRP